MLPLPSASLTACITLRESPFLARRPGDRRRQRRAVRRAGGPRGRCLGAAARGRAASDWRGGNSQHTRNLRCMHDAPQDVLIDAYPEEEYWQDLLKVTGGRTDEQLARIAIRDSSTCRDWMRRHGVRFQPSLSGALHAGAHQRLLHGRRQGARQRLLPQRRTRSASRSATTRRWTRSSSTATASSRPAAATSASRRAAACWRPAASNRTASGCARRGARTSVASGRRRQFLIRGTRFNTGVLLRFLLDAGADAVGDPTQAHMVAIDARAPLYDGGICTRIDCVSLGIVVNRDGAALLRRGRGLLAEALRDLGPAGRAAAGADRLVGHRREGGRPLHAAGVPRHAAPRRCRSSRARSA